MSLSVDSLHKILKDKTRRKILLLLNEKNSLSYVDLMKALEISNTGRMNYHLKILGNLVSKDENGRYMLTERGKLATRLLQEFPGDYVQEYRRWIPAILTVYAVLVLVVGFLALNPRYIQQFFLTTLIAVAVGILFLALITWNRKFRIKFQKVLTNYYTRTEKPSFSVSRRILSLSIILLASILTFLAFYYYDPILLNSSPIFVYIIFTLLIAFLITVMILTISLLKTTLKRIFALGWDWGGIKLRPQPNRRAHGP
jgi:DNA-binding transcriptional ArsR family regulator